jgi:hypothetical protein
MQSPKRYPFQRGTNISEGIRLASTSKATFFAHCESNTPVVFDQKYASSCTVFEAFISTTLLSSNKPMTSSNEGRFQQGSNHCKVPLIIINTAATSSAVPDTITIVGAVPGTVTVAICEVSIESDGAAAPMDVESGRSLVVAAQGRLESPRRPMQLQKKTLRLEDEHRSEVLDTFFRKMEEDSKKRKKKSSRRVGHAPSNRHGPGHVFPMRIPCFL